MFRNLYDMTSKELAEHVEKLESLIEAFGEADQIEYRANKWDRGNAKPKLLGTAFAEEDAETEIVRDLVVGGLKRTLKAWREALRVVSGREEGRQQLNE